MRKNKSVMSELREEAKKYAKQGIFVFPLRPRRKIPFSYREFRKPTCDETIIDDMWNAFPLANIAAPTSIKFNALVIIDIDIKHNVDGRISMDRLLKENNLQLPETSMVRSGSGGVHYYFKNNTNKKIDSSGGYGLGIDIRSEHAYAILPPSINNRGNMYEWIQGDYQSMAFVNQDVLAFVEIVNRINNTEKKEQSTNGKYYYQTSIQQ